MQSQERVGEGGAEVVIAREKSSGGPDTEGIRAALWEHRGTNEFDGHGRSSIGDPERWKTGVAGVHGIREIGKRRIHCGFPRSSWEGQATLVYSGGKEHGRRVGGKIGRVR